MTSSRLPISSRGGLQLLQGPGEKGEALPGAPDQRSGVTVHHFLPVRSLAPLVKLTRLVGRFGCGPLLQQLPVKAAVKGAAIKAVGHDPPHQIRVLQPRVQGGPGTAAGPHQKDGTKAQVPDQSGGLPALVDPELGVEAPASAESARCPKNQAGYSESRGYRRGAETETSGKRRCSRGGTGGEDPHRSRCRSSASPDRKNRAKESTSLIRIGAEGEDGGKARRCGQPRQRDEAKARIKEGRIEADQGAPLGGPGGEGEGDPNDAQADAGGGK